MTVTHIIPLFFFCPSCERYIKANTCELFILTSLIIETNIDNKLYNCNYCSHSPTRSKPFFDGCTSKQLLDATKCFQERSLFCSLHPNQIKLYFRTRCKKDNSFRRLYINQVRVIFSSDIVQQCYHEPAKICLLTNIGPHKLK